MFFPNQNNPQNPDHIGRVEKRGHYLVVCPPLNAHRGCLQVDHRIRFGLALRNSNLVAHLSNCDDPALKQSALFEVGQVFDLVGRPNELGDEGCGKGHGGQGTSLRMGVNVDRLTQRPPERGSAWGG